MPASALVPYTPGGYSVGAVRGDGDRSSSPFVEAPRTSPPPTDVSRRQFLELSLGVVAVPTTNWNAAAGTFFAVHGGSPSSAELLLLPGTAGNANKITLSLTTNTLYANIYDGAGTNPSATIVGGRPYRAVRLCGVVHGRSETALLRT